MVKVETILDAQQIVIWLTILDVGGFGVKTFLQEFRYSEMSIEQSARPLTELENSSQQSAKTASSAPCFVGPARPAPSSHS